MRKGQCGNARDEAQKPRMASAGRVRTGCPPSGEGRGITATAAWGAFRGTVTRPGRTFVDLATDRHAARHGAFVLFAVCIVYTLILLAFLGRGYPAAARSALGLAVEDQYGLQVWYQAPLFFAVTCLTAAVLVLASRASGQPVGFGLAFGRVSLATAVPFASTTMVVEAAAALLLAAGLVKPADLLSWLTGPGAWFALLYQVVGLAWLAALVLVATRTILGRGWRVSVPVALLLLVVYGVPVALLIR